SLWEYQDREAEGAPFRAPESNVEYAFDFLMSHPRSVPAGTFVFVLSDFLVPPPAETWLRALEQRWDVIPVVLQDPLWERSFPDLDGFVVELADAGGRSQHVRLRRREVAERRRANETRWEKLVDDFARLARPQRIRSDDGSTTRLRYLYLLTCDTFVCLTGDKTERTIHFAPATVRYRDRHGKEATLIARWPRFRFVSRFGGPRYLPQ